MRRKISVLIGLVIAVILVAALFAFHHWNNLEWMQRTSGVRLPRGIQDVSVYDRGEMYVTAHVLLPSAAVNDFAKAFSFSPSSNARSGLLGMEQLDPRFRNIPLDADLVTYTGRSQKNTWKFVLDRRSGHLWFTVQYPDFSGDPP